MTKKRAAIYARVSTDETRQNPKTQLRELRLYAKHRGFPIVAEYVDTGSGASTDREQYQALREAARRRRFDVVLVWRYDRFARSTVELVNALEEFRVLGVDFISHQEQVDTTTPQGKLVFSIMASLAEFERSLISSRVRAGMARAREQGKRIGRAPIPEKVRREIARLRATSPSPSVRTIAKKLGLGVGTTWRYLREVKAPSLPKSQTRRTRQAPSSSSSSGRRGSRAS